MAETALFDYALTKTKVANPDHTHAAVVTDCPPVSVPGSTPYGPISDALAFDASSSIVAPFPTASVDAKRFTVRVIFRVTSALTARQNLVESTCLPFSVHLLPGNGATAFQAVGTVNNVRNGWSGAATLERIALQLNHWYALDLVYDIDTLALFVDKQRIAVSAFPSGALAPLVAGELVLGVHPDKVRFHFIGDMARAQVFADIPEDLEAREDESRATAEWHIRLKENEVAGTIDLGGRQADVAYRSISGMEVQRFERGLIGYTDGYPAAFALHGANYQRYLAGNLEAALAGLVSDEQPARVPGAVRSAFEGGAIYWSGQTGAHEIIGRMYLDYELLGGSVSLIGLPIARPERISGGQVQIFEHGRMYYRDDASNAFEVHGDILAKYTSTGESGRWGFPTSNETDVLHSVTGDPVGRQSQFEGCTILWSLGTGAHIVYGAIRDTYNARGGAGAAQNQKRLGFPTSDEQDIPGVGGLARYNTFEYGSILFRDGVITVATPFTFYLGNLNTEESEGWGMGQNDLYVFAEIWIDGAKIFAKRYPDDGSWGGDNSHNIDAHLPPEINPNRGNLVVELKVDVWDEDGGFGGGDDHIGTFSKVLNVSNGWGLFDNAFGLFTATGVGGIKSLDWSIDPVVPPNTPKDFWGVTNQSTPTLSYTQYDEAFTDIDDDPEWSDPGDWAERKYFNDSIKGAASSGNCFGMCVEALHAWNGNSRFSLPLARFNSWTPVANDINIKQIYWFGSDCLWFTDKQIKDQKLSAPEVFKHSRQSNNAGNPAVIYFFANSNYSGSGHAVLALDWDDSSVPWIITVFDPNQQNSKQKIAISPTSNAFYFTSAGLTYGGGPGTGAIGYVPFSSVNHRQASPVWDPTLLLLAGLVIALGADGSTESIKDSAGNNLWLNANFSGDPKTYAGQFWTVGALDGRMNGELLLRRIRRSPRFWNTARALSTPLSALLSAMVRQHEPGQEAELNPQPLPSRLATLLAQSDLSEAVLSRSLQELAADSLATSDRKEGHRGSDDFNASDFRSGGLRANDFDSAIGVAIDSLRRQSSAYGGDYTHVVRGKRRGQFSYTLKYKLAQTRLLAAMDRGETHTIDASGVGGSQPITRIVAGRDKMIQIEHVSRIGTSSDFMRLRISNLPLRAGLDMNVSVRPGLAAVDVLTGGQRVDAEIEVETLLGGAHKIHNFTYAMEGGLRVLPRTLFDSGGLKAGRIETLFGNIQDATILI